MIEILKAVGDENRVRILNLLMRHELCVCELEVVLSLSQTNLSRHLAKLKAANLIVGDKSAQWVHYKISDTFKEEHALLLEYIEKQCNTEAIFIEDALKCEIYKQSAYNCQTIRNNREIVETYIEQEKKAKH